MIVITAYFNMYFSIVILLFSHGFSSVLSSHIMDRLPPAAWSFQFQSQEKSMDHDSAPETLTTSPTTADTATDATTSTTADTATDATTSTTADTATDLTTSTAAKTATDSTTSTTADTATDSLTSTTTNPAIDSNTSTTADTSTDSTPSTTADTATDLTTSTTADTATDSKTSTIADTSTDSKTSTTADTSTDSKTSTTAAYSEVASGTTNTSIANNTVVAHATNDSEGVNQDVDDAGHIKNCNTQTSGGIPLRYTHNYIPPTICENATDKQVWPDPYTKIRLPKNVKPERYHVDMFPHIYNESDFTFDCETTIIIHCNEDTDIIHLHSMEHGISLIEISEHAPPAPDASIQAPHDESTDELKVEECGTSTNNEMLHIKLNKDLKKGRRYKLKIISKSKISNDVMGFYASPYTEKDTCEEKFVFTSMMEPTHARFVFPCFDEPDFKAIFTMTIKRQSHMTSVMNLPLRTTIGPDADGYYIDVFDQSLDVPMSTYLVALGVAELEYIEAYYKDIRSRVWARKDIINQTTYLLDASVKFLEFFEGYFQIPYSLPKLDAITVPDMSFSGMEHWGLVTYRENAVAYDSPTSEDIVWQTALISHEVAHQWFGNLVSPYWWDDLWLNEGFATYMMYMATEEVMPDLDMKNRVAIDFRGIQNVLRVDQKIDSHPVYIAVHHPKEIQDIFDLISYAKGSAVIRMMNFFLGDHTFKHGLRRYLLRHSYDTATHSDLFAALSEQAEDDGLEVTDVKSVMDTWILEQNYPVVTLEFKNSSVCFHQTAFLETEDGRKNRSHITWKIPVTCTTSSQTDFHQKPSDIIWLNEKSLCVDGSSLPSDDWVVCNLQQLGFYRVNYPNANWQHIIDQLKKDPFSIHTINRAQVINDAWELHRAGLLDIEIALQTFDYLHLETEYVPWTAAIKELNILSDYLKLTAKYGLFLNFMRKKLKTVYFKSGSPSIVKEKLLHSLISKHACIYGLEACINDALNMYSEWVADENISLDPDLVETVFCTAARQLDEKFYDIPEKLRENPGLFKAYNQSKACVEVPWKVIRLMDMYRPIPDWVENAGEMVSTLTTTETGRLLAWVYFVDYWKRDRCRMCRRIILEATEKMSTTWELDQLRQFMNVTELWGWRDEFAFAERTVSARVKYIDTHRAAIHTWLQGTVEVQG